MSETNNKIKIRGIKTTDKIFVAYFLVIIVFTLVVNVFLFLAYERLDVKHDTEIMNLRERLTNQSSVSVSDLKDRATTILEDADADDKEKVRQILQHSGIQITPEIESMIPTWSEVSSMYGSKPKIIGLETCDTFQTIIPVSEAYVGPSGLFNTGTNLLAKMLSKHCKIPKHNIAGGMLWQVPWGKHNPISLRLKHVAAASTLNVNQSKNVLPVVTIKDPYHWMGSMCRHSYAANWYHSEEHCPNLIPNQVDVDHRGITLNSGPIGVSVRFQPDLIPQYESLVGLWNDWYGDYMSVNSFPRLIIRSEDLIFHLEEVLTQVCHCGGGEVEGDIKMISESAKGDIKAHANANGLIGAISRYGHSEKRTEGMTKDDLHYAQATLRKDLMDFFGYLYPRYDNTTK